MRTVSNFKEWAYEKAREFDQFKKIMAIYVVVTITEIQFLSI